MHKFTRYLLPILIAGPLLAALATGLNRLWWRGAGQPAWLFAAVDPLLHADLFTGHPLVGLIAGSLALVACFFLLFTARRSLPHFLLTFFVLTALLSGLALLVDIFTGGVTVVIHRFFAWGTLGLFVWWLIRHFRSTSVESHPMTRRRWLGWGIAVITVIVLLMIPGVIRLITPDTLRARYYEYGPVHVDGSGYDRAWRVAGYVELPIIGGRLYPHGATTLRIWAVRHRFDVYFLIRWADDRPSTNRWLQKGERAWIELQSDPPERFGERVWWEDNMAISLSDNPRGCAATCHVTNDNMTVGYHATDGDTVDVWRWYVIRSTPVRTAEDGWWGKRSDSTNSMHVDNRAGGGYRSNLNLDWLQPYLMPSRFYGFPWVDVASPYVSAYFHEADDLPVGYRVPAVIVAKSQGDVTDVEAVGRWDNGFWTVEMRRRISTGSPFDRRLIDSLYLSVALFNNAEKHHAMQLTPVQLIVDPLPGK